MTLCALRRLEGFEIVPYRVHNDLLETIATVGIAGLVFRAAILQSALLGTWWLPRALLRRRHQHRVANRCRVAGGDRVVVLAYSARKSS